MKLNPRSFACVVPVLLALGCGSSGPSANDAGGAAGGGSGGSSAGATGAAGHGGAGAAGGGSAAGAGGGGGSAGGAAGTGSGGSGATDGGSDGPAPPLDGPRADSRDGQSAADGASSNACRLTKWNVDRLSRSATAGLAASALLLVWLNASAHLRRDRRTALADLVLLTPLAVLLLAFR